MRHQNDRLDNACEVGRQELSTFVIEGLADGVGSGVGHIVRAHSNG